MQENENLNEKTGGRSVHVAITGGFAGPEDRYGKILIMGRAQTGKTTIARRLAEMTGLTLLKTSTNRPKRSPDEDTYHFYTREESDRIPEDQKLFRTDKVDEYERWTGYDDFLAAGIAVLDPTAMSQAVQLWQAQGYRVTVLYCGDPEEARRARWMKDLAADDGSDWDEVLEKFGTRERIEAPMFDPLEDKIRSLQELAEADAMLYPDADPEKHDLADEDALELFMGDDKPDLERFPLDFHGRLGAGDRQGRIPFRRSASREDLVFEPEDWTEAEWRVICRILGLVPGNTARAVVKKPVIEYFAEPGNKNEYKEVRDHA